MDRPWKLLTEHLTSKWVIVGARAAGKSSLLMRWSGQGFSENIPATIGVDLKYANHGCALGNIEVQIWDTAGQERFRPIIRTYYRACDVLILCFSLTSRESFLAVEGYWKEAQTSGEYSVVALIGTRLDCTEHREVASQEPVLYAQCIGALYFELSNKTNEGTDEALKKILEALLKTATFVKNDRVDLEKTIKKEEECGC